MSRTRIVVGILLAGLFGPGLGITANTSHNKWLIVPALLLSWIGIALILRENSRR